MDNNVDKRASVSRRLDERIGTLQEWISMITGQDEPIGTHSDQTQKPVGVTLCQFDSDLRHHVFRHEKALWLYVRGLLLELALPRFDNKLITRAPLN